MTGFFQDVDGGISNIAVGDSHDLRRIESLPRRTWENERSNLGSILRTPNGTMTLLNVQETALREMMQIDGLLGALAVGAGKAIISILAATVLRAQRPILLVPASLKIQTTDILIPAMKKHWRLHPGLRVYSYNDLSDRKNARLLEALQPDQITADEVHALKDRTSARTRRIIRYMRAFPRTRFVGLSGTIARTSILDFAHILAWCLKSQTPLPLHWPELQAWASALDLATLAPTRSRPGALARLCAPGESVRQGTQRRLRDTRGVLFSGTDQLGCSLTVAERLIDCPSSILSVLSDMLETWTTPDGYEIFDAVHLWKKKREIAQGFYTRYDPHPPLEWRRARSAWARVVTETIRQNRRGLDTERQVRDWYQANNPNDETYCWYIEQTRAFKPRGYAVWLDDFLVRDACTWIIDGGHIVWAESPAIGHAIATRAGVPYYGAGTMIGEDTKPPFVASIDAHGKGRNLQFLCNSNYICACPSSGARWEQVLGRTHRRGQPADRVYATVPLHTQDFRDSFERALDGARYWEEQYGERQKLLYCDRLVPGTRKETDNE